MSEAIVAQNSPYAVEVEAGRSYWWCACGRSQRQPLCDGSHQGTAFTPTEYKAEKSATVYFCGCKHTAHAPMCDGSHQKL